MADLSGVRIAAICSHGVEESELVEPVRRLRDAGADVEILSPDGSPVQAMRHDDKSDLIESDGSVPSRDPDTYDGLLLPGGALNADKLRMDDNVRDFLRRMDAANKPVAAICHAPWVLVSAGLVESKQLTSYYTLQDDIRNAGGFWVDREVVIDGNWITSRRPADIPAFVEAFAGKLSELRAAAGQRPRK